MREREFRIWDSNVKQYMLEKRLSGTDKWKWYLITDRNVYSDRSIISDVGYDYRVTGLDANEQPVTEPSSVLGNNSSYCYRGIKWQET